MIVKIIHEDDRIDWYETPRASLLPFSKEQPHDVAVDVFHPEHGEIRIWVGPTEEAYLLNDRGDTIQRIEPVVRVPK